jgi:hypothetical protein
LESKDIAPKKRLQIANTRHLPPTRAGLHRLSLERVLRALTAFDVFTEVYPGTFDNNEASRLFRNCPGGLWNWALFPTAEQFLKSAGALGHSLETGQPAHDHAFGQTVLAEARRITVKPRRHTTGREWTLLLTLAAAGMHVRRLPQAPAPHLSGAEGVD